ncbi:YihY/virulence factor BrkB family protein [Salipaludibacillus agaradhaerens]|uniref:YihY/virulence factor BrkB family protein n=1 Tax=Salipaludibacillus agaradhaerens TaxID=76935 RepID=A0A9Q4G0B9_SALAG|nr:YihY/virulence factor BrkB family protein [Salipaludibacillus agaradhaerens]MCR6097922.1 YihY/virulence factor BrkB family protein [Salipaludibacillus agaradhaerens]MCR6109301.1 YihY/virulence factor BrkB family protein [Bacillus sp. A301a_S52]MCR6116449.1 YihY/virulence factor BrkB family protein [Salipaludibacillus agaradhaerens]
MFKLLWTRFNQHNLIDLGAQCAYYFLLSLFPFLIFIISLLTFLPFTFQDVYRLLQEAYIPTGVLEVIENQWQVLERNQQTGALSLGIIFTLWTASLALNAIIRALNTAYHVSAERGMVMARLTSIILTISMFFVIIVALGVQIIGSQLQHYLEFDLGLFEIDVFRWLFTSAVTFLVFLILYLVGPNIRLHFREVYIGAIVATIGWQLTSYGFSIYLNTFANYSATYGTIGTVIALMVWFHLSSLILLLGGEVNAILKEDRHHL